LSRGKRRYCPTPTKAKHFNEAWGKIAAEEQAEKYGGSFRTYRCQCGWWHTFDRKKARAKDNARESQHDRRRRSKRGDPPPFSHLVVQREREKLESVRYRNLRKKQARQLPLRVWEDDGGAFW
jgi:hypothetical protein